MKKLTLFLFVFTSILFAISVQAQVGPEQARNYQIDETHTGSINSAGLTAPQAKVESELRTKHVLSAYCQRFIVLFMLVLSLNYIPGSSADGP